MSEQSRNRIRVHYSANALIKSGKRGTIHGIVRDISIDAMYLSCEPVFSIDEKINVEIVLLGKNSELIIKIAGTVTRIDEDGIALSFFNPLEWWPIFSHFPLHRLDDKSLTKS
ncbi:PilZ domain-containing protein [Desulfogranum marinum]|uniref:PilZ domain-containing protein n=1 Tax=Desulfogranum marinum TaxID=453220 RepID=UPI0019669B27|nr:PilZ domain-containing protein [Desulfogranum marinum]MBM9512376.1 PilZ domain-containing protein [Desulfogranum marinum]